MRHSTTFLMSLIVASILVLMFLNLVLGSVSIPLKSVWNIICGLGDEPVTWQNIVWKSRLPQALTALVAGAGLAISGLQMQTVFRNPLAGPSVLGIDRDFHFPNGFQGACDRFYAAARQTGLDGFISPRRAAPAGYPPRRNRRGRRAEPGFRARPTRRRCPASVRPPRSRGH